MPASLAERATEINRLFERADQSDTRANRQRWEAGGELIAAKALVRHGEWQQWCKANITRSLRDVQKVMHMAGADDPMAEHEAEKESKREARAVRSKASPGTLLVPTVEPTPQQDEHPESSVVRFVPKGEDVASILSRIDRLTNMSDLTRVRAPAKLLAERDGEGAAKVLQFLNRAVLRNSLR